MKRGRKKLNNKYLLEKLKEAVVLLGRPVSRPDIKNLSKNKQGFPSATTYDRHFGSWNKAKQLAGIPLINTGTRNPNTRQTCLGLRFEVFQRDNFFCQYCGRTPQDGARLVCDHIKPSSKGGLTILENLITSCSECNYGKRDVILEQTGKFAKKSSSR